jgi:hypothetical protein
MKLQGLELEIEGAREDASAISQNIGAQLSSMMQPVTGIIEGEPIVNRPPSFPSLPQILNGSPKRNRRRKQATPVNGESEASSAIDFVLSPEKYGSPSQQWKTADKAIWLIYVLEGNGSGNEFTTGTLVETFNKHFKQSGTITTRYVTRDLGRLKTKSKPSLVGENTTKTPSTWFLTEEGRKRVQALISESLVEAGKS